jgi:hypothetical protein
VFLGPRRVYLANQLARNIRRRGETGNEGPRRYHTITREEK